MKANIQTYRVLRFVGMGILGILTAAIFAFLFGFFVMKLWNWLIPSLFNLRMINYWEGFGLVLLARLIFGSVNHDRGHYRHKHERYWPGHHENWNCSENQWRIKGGWKNWHFYEEWWQTEGRSNFEQYLEARENKPTDLE